MAKNHKRTQNIIRNEIMQRIDNMKDDKDFNPYEPNKKLTIENEELFNDKNYDDVEEESSSEGTGLVVGIIIGIALVALTVAVVILIL